ncbi:MAG: PilZ domain-containing protein [Deltaproteobacteria bacterium]|nr:MAG: PilZ domain-containing protein [Deltaproteobacteria bacterium]
MSLLQARENRMGKQNFVPHGLHDLNPQKKMGVLAIEKRKHPRFSVELPLDYSRVDGKETYGGIVANASEGGLLVYLPEVINLGDSLRIEIFYASGLELNSIKAIAKVVWYDLAAKESWGEHRYGLQFQAIEEKDLERLKALLREIGK